MSPVDIATRRREADRKELEHAKSVGDWGAALDVIHANVHEIESLVVRSLSKHDATHAEIAAVQGLLESVLVSVGQLHIAIEEKAAAPSYRPSMTSASQLDAQALGQTIENIYAVLSGTDVAIAARLAVLEGTIGAEPNLAAGKKGTGLAGIVHRLDSKSTIVKLALLTAIAGAVGTNIAELVKHLLHLGGAP